MEDNQGVPKRARDADASASGAAAAADSAPASSAGRSCSSSFNQALPQFQTASACMQRALDALFAGVQAERAELAMQRAQLEGERRAFEEERNKIAQVLSDNEQVILDVGGHRFSTTVLTLRNAPAPSLFSAMFSGRHALPHTADGSIFVDRDGRHFADILNYLRTSQLAYPWPPPPEMMAVAVGPVAMPSTSGGGGSCNSGASSGVGGGGGSTAACFKYLLELRAEAEFYGLTGLVSLIDRYPFNISRVVRSSCISNEDRWVYEDGADEVLVSVDRPCQLLGVGLCGTEASYTAELAVLQVDPDDFTQEVGRLCYAARTFTKLDGDVVRLDLPEPVALLPGRYYMLQAAIKGMDSLLCEDCLEVVVAGGVRVTFHCWESPNGTNETRGQFPELYIRALPGS